MGLEKLFKEPRTIKELYNAGLRYHDQHNGIKIFQDENRQTYYFRKTNGLYHHTFHTTAKPPYNKMRM